MRRRIVQRKSPARFAVAREAAPGSVERAMRLSEAAGERTSAHELDFEAAGWN